MKAMHNLKIVLLVIVLVYSCFNSSEVNSAILPALTFRSISEPGSDPIMSDFLKGGTRGENTFKGWSGSNSSLERDLQIENWMLETDWLEKFEFINEFDLQLEKWMVDFEWVQNKEKFSEPGLYQESWMITPQYWKLPASK